MHLSTSHFQMEDINIVSHLLTHSFTHASQTSSSCQLLFIFLGWLIIVDYLAIAVTRDVTHASLITCFISVNNMWFMKRMKSAIPCAMCHSGRLSGAMLIYEWASNSTVTLCLLKIMFRWLCLNNRLWHMTDASHDDAVVLLGGC